MVGHQPHRALRPRTAWGSSRGKRFANQKIHPTKSVVVPFHLPIQKNPRSTSAFTPPNRDRQHRQHVGRPDLRKEEDLDRGRPVQAGQRSDPRQRQAPQAVRREDPAPQAVRAPPGRRPRQLRQARHPRPRLRWWSRRPGLRRPPGHCQGHCCLLRQVRRRALQEPAEGCPHQLRPHPPRRRLPTIRAQEVRRSRCPLQIPEVVPMILLHLVGRFGMDGIVSFPVVEKSQDQ